MITSYFIRRKRNYDDLASQLPASEPPSTPLQVPKLLNDQEMSDKIVNMCTRTDIKVGGMSFPWLCCGETNKATKLTPMYCKFCVG